MPVRVVFSRVSADPSVQIYSSSDGGTTWDTTAFSSFSIGRIATGTGQATIRLPTGQYVVQLNAYTSSDHVTFQVLTGVVITAINNV